MRCTVARARRFDAAGDSPTTVTKDGQARTLYYDEQGRVARVKLGTANSTAPSVYNYYNEHGQRIFRTEPLTDAAFKAASPTGKLTNQLAGVNFYYNLQNQLVFQKGTGTSNKHSQDAYYFWLGDIPVGVFNNQGAFNIYADHLNTPRKAFNWDEPWGQNGSNSKAAWQWNYSPFGDNQPTTARNNFKEEHWDALNLGTVTRNTSAPDLVLDLRYPGQFYDHSTGLHQNWMRMYDPQTARYTRADPIGLNGGMNRYAYVGGNALWAVDERGEAANVLPAVGRGTLICLKIPACRAAMTKGVNEIVKSMSGSKPVGNVYSEAKKDKDKEAQEEVAEEEEKVECPPLPDVLVGDQSSEHAGPNKKGGKHTSGNLLPEYGGIGDWEKDLETVGGRVRPWRPGDKAPSGSLVGENGVFGRPKNSSGGASIDIPSNGKGRPHETLHYD